LAFIESYIDSGLTVITLADSEGGNRLNMDSLSELSHAINAALMNDEVRVILIRSNGANFCLGMDLVFLTDAEGDRSIGEYAVGLYVDLLLKIYESPKPVIALVDGEVKAGGIGLVAACDIVIASENSSFSLTEVLFGLIPANVLPFIFGLRLTPQRARYLIMTAKRVSADEAKIIGLVDEVFSEDDLEKETRAIIKNLFRANPSAISLTKHFTMSIMFKELNESTNMAKEKLLELVGKPEIINAVKAFNEGSTPEWFAKFKPQKSIVREK
jgi:enoyl-CoA hydratase/carnithine racemase